MTYTWTNDDTSIGLAASGTGDIASFTATNTGTAPVTSTIVVTPHFENGTVTCDGPIKDIYDNSQPDGSRLISRPTRLYATELNNCGNFWNNKYRRYSDIYLDK